MQLTTGQYRVAGQIFGSYRCLALLGEGGMGHVYLAEHIRLGRKVALKRLKDRVAAEPEAVAQFMTEAQAVNRIRHPHIVDITDFCNDDSGVYYLMELLEGHTVAELLRAEGPMSERRVLYIAHQMADALEAAHQAHVLHLDLKPSNIFLVERGGQADFAKLLDFGIARLRDAAVSDVPEKSSSDMGPVTPAFMAPEQATTRPVDPRTDLYSLGAVLYAMLAGRPPFEAQTLAEFVHKHLNVVPTPLTRLKDLPEPVSAPCSRLVARCLQKRPGDRPQSAAELRELLAQVAETSVGIRLVAGHPPETAPVRWPWRRIGMGAGLVLVVVAIVGLLALNRAGETPAPAKAGEAKRAPGHDDAVGRVTLRLVSTPPGAEVFREDGPRRLLGLTPLLVTDLPVGGSVVLRLRLARHRDRTLRVSLGSRDHTVRTTLDPEPGPMGMGRPGPRPMRGPHAPGWRRRVSTMRPEMRHPPVMGAPRPMTRTVPRDTTGTVDPFGM